MRLSATTQLIERRDADPLTLVEHLSERTPGAFGDARELVEICDFLALAQAVFLFCARGEIGNLTTDGCTLT
jgi:hypothetical protein